MPWSASMSSHDCPLGLLPACLEVRDTPAYGRGLYARETIRHGLELLKATPLAHIVKGELRTTVCQGCLGKFQKLLRCGGCKFIHYCSRDCQREDWTCHKVECSGLQRVNAGAQGVKEPTDTMRLVVRLVAMTTASQSAKQQLDSLVEMDSKEMSDDVKTEMASQVMGVALLLGKDKSDIGAASAGASEAEIFATLSRVTCNTFNVLGVGGAYEEVVGLGVYATPSLLNHSCDPNCVVVFRGRELLVRSVLPVSKGEQLFISYCELLEARSRRQAHLRKVYSFTCSCTRCQTEESESSPLHVMYAARDASVSEEKKRGAMEAGESLLDQHLKQLEKNNDWPGFVAKCRDFVGGRGRVLHPLNVVLTGVLEQQMRGQLVLERWEEAVGTGQLLTRAYNYCLPPFHPSHLLHLAKMGKLRRLLATDHHLRKSVQELQEAADRIPVTFGRDSPLMSEVVMMLRDSQMELEARTS